MAKVEALSYNALVAEIMAPAVKRQRARSR
jgi:hypothetical protein